MTTLAERLRAAAEDADLGSLSELAGRAEVSETVVSEALRAVKCPTERTLQGLLKACGVPFDTSWDALRRAASKAWRAEQSKQRELERAAAARLAPVVVRSRSAPELELRRRMLAGHAHVGADGDLPLVSQVHDRALLGIHPAPPLRSSRPGVVLDTELPSYVLRDSDTELRPHVRHARDHGGLVLVYGPSTAGKTRAAAEAMWAELAGWSLLVPVVPESLEHLAAARLDLTRTVIWLNELHVYLGAGGRQADALTRLLAQPDKPVLLASIRAHQLSDLEEGTGQGARDDGQEAQLLSDRKITAVRSVLSRARRVRMERMFSAVEVERAKDLSSDTRLATALRSAGRYGVAEALAAGPELLHLLDAQTDAAEGHFAGAALVHASVDVARVGWSRPVQPSLLRELLPHYVSLDLRPEIDDALFDRELRWARRLRRGFSRLLVDDESGTGVRAFDYLIDHAQTRLPQAAVPAALWTALLGEATAEEALELGHQAQRWKEADIAVAAWRTAASSPDREVATKASGALGRLLLERADAQEALPYLLQAAEGGDWWAGSNAVDWYVARSRFEDALPVLRWRAEGSSSRGTRRELCNALAALAHWQELAEVAKRFRASDPQMVPVALTWYLAYLAKWDPDRGRALSADELMSVFCERVDRRWWEHRVKDLMAHFNDRASHPGQHHPRYEVAPDRAVGAVRAVRAVRAEERGQEPADRVGQLRVLHPRGVRRGGLQPGLRSGRFHRRSGRVRPAVTAAGLGDGNGEEPQPPHRQLLRYTRGSICEARGERHRPHAGPRRSVRTAATCRAVTGRRPHLGASRRNWAIRGEDAVAVPDSSHTPSTVSANPAGPPTTPPPAASAPSPEPAAAASPPSAGRATEAGFTGTAPVRSTATRRAAGPAPSAAHTPTRTRNARRPRKGVTRERAPVARAPRRDHGRTGGGIWNSLEKIGENRCLTLRRTPHHPADHPHRHKAITPHGEHGGKQPRDMRGKPRGTYQSSRPEHSPRLIKAPCRRSCISPWRASTSPPGRSTRRHTIVVVSRPTGGLRRGPADQSQSDAGWSTRPPLWGVGM
ncbi:hypothetical protein [Streptomyces sp. NPDC056549]|uniref:hypothetical protein n=1 Tax=Streptomyces sp. NPDC056549 TaxID=3345864 RepID=UPI0036BEA5E6